MVDDAVGQFIDLAAGYTHADSLGGALTSLIQGISTHLLVHDVKVDLPGRDNVRDFLALDVDVLRVYESEGVDTLVTDQSANAHLQPGGAGQVQPHVPGDDRLRLRQAARSIRRTGAAGRRRSLRRQDIARRERMAVQDPQRQSHLVVLHQFLRCQYDRHLYGGLAGSGFASLSGTYSPTRTTTV